MGCFSGPARFPVVYATLARAVQTAGSVSTLFLSLTGLKVRIDLCVCVLDSLSFTAGLLFTRRGVGFGDWESGLEADVRVRLWFGVVVRAGLLVQEWFYLWE